MAASSDGLTHWQPDDSMSKVMSMFHFFWTLAQYPEKAPGADARFESEVIRWGIILIGVIVVGGAAIMLIRRKLRDSAASSSADTGFSLSDLRAMRDRGEITSEEYEQTRARVIAKVKGKPVDPPRRETPPSSGAEGPPSDESPGDSSPSENSSS
jgi:hypothetical protein